MKTIKIASCLLVLSTLLQSCYKREFWPVQGKGDVVSNQREVGAFTGIRLSNDASVEYQQDSIYSVTVSGQSNILNVLETTVVGQELRIDYTREVWDHKEVKVIVKSPLIYSMHVSGSGKISSEGPVMSERLNLAVSGSGNLLIRDLNSPAVSAGVSGSGNIELLGGNTTGSIFEVSGSGNINSEYLISQYNTSKISGSGNITVNASEQIEVNISGSGTFYYKGNASVNSSVSGSGKIRKI